MKKLFLIAFGIIVALQVFPQDQKAKEILEEVTRTLKSCNTIQADFVYTTESQTENVSDENHGQAILKGEKYKLELLSLGLEIFCDGKLIWSYMEDANEVSITTVDDETTVMMNPARLFTIYQQGFTNRFVEEKNVDGVAVYIIDLLPDEEESFEYEKIRIQIDKNHMLIRNALMVGHDGNNYIVKVENIKKNIPVDDKIFTFNKTNYPGVEEVDLR